MRHGAFTTGNGGFGWGDADVCWPEVYKGLCATEWFEAYAVGAAPVMSGGWGLTGSAVWPAPYKDFVGREDFEAYAVGAVNGSDLTGGSGWSGAALVRAVS